MNTRGLDNQYIMPTYARLDIEIVNGKGAELFDADGKRYIDLGSGIAVNSLGIADDGWVDAITKQAKLLQHVSNYYYTAPQSELAKALCERTIFKRVFFSNSGAEANECAIKAARKYASDKYGDKRQTILTLNGGFHGRTIATLSATGQPEFHKHFMPFLQGFKHIEPNDEAELLEAVKNNDCSAIMIELVQGEGGVNVLNKSYVKLAAQLCADNDIILIVDEVQTGNGRTGTLYAYSQFDIEPDIISTAKGLAGGLPIGATLFNDKVCDTLNSGTHGSTFGGNPICAAAALYTLSQLDDKFLLGVTERADYIRSELENAKGVKSVSGLGLMIGIETEGDAKAIMKRCVEHGLLVLTAKDKLRLLPPLNIPMAQLKEGISILKEEL